MENAVSKHVVDVSPLLFFSSSQLVVMIKLKDDPELCRYPRDCGEFIATLLL